MSARPLPKEPVLGIQPIQVFEDNRGHFREIVNFSVSPFKSQFMVQQNVSVNKKNVFRGMHYQLHNPQGKLVTVLYGSVVDFILDLRSWSPNFHKVMSFNLNANNPNTSTLWVPPGFAHGFYSLEEGTVFSYNVFDNPRVVNDEYSINPRSIPAISLFLEETNVIMSAKDGAGLDLQSAPSYV